MDTLIIATYNFLPLHHGGTEVYLINFLRLIKDKKILVIASSSYEEVLQYTNVTLEKETQRFRLFTYELDMCLVLGVEIFEPDAFENYSKQNDELQILFKEVLTNLGFINCKNAYFHGFSLIAGVSLMKILSKNAKISIWVHTSISCASNLLVNNGQECKVKTNVNECGNCLINHNKRKLFKSIFLSMNLLSLRKIGKINNYYEFARLHFEALDFLKDRVNKIVCFSDNMKELLALNGWPVSKIFVDQHGIDDIYLNANIKKPIGKVIFGFSGRWIDIKGIDVIKKAWLKLPNSITDLCELHIASGITDSDQQKSTEFFEKSNVKTLGFLKGIDLVSFYRQIHYLIIPSVWVETGPLVFHEAISQGCNVIASEIGGNISLSQLYINNTYLYKFDDPESLAKVIESCVLNFDSYKEANYKVKPFKNHADSIFKEISY